MAEEGNETGEVGECNDGGSDGGCGEGESRDAGARAEFEDDGGSCVGGGVPSKTVFPDTTGGGLFNLSAHCVSARAILSVPHL